MLASIYDRMGALTVHQAVGIVLLTVPGYILFKDLTKKAKTVPHRKTVIDHDANEQKILKAKIREESSRAGPAFVDSHVYHNRRVDRVKATYTSCWRLVNDALNAGHQTFTIDTFEDDLRILKVVEKLIVEELDVDGYTAKISIIKPNIDQGSEKHNYQFKVNIV